MNLARGFRLRNSGDAGRGEAHQGLFTFGDAEMAEQVASDAIVRARLPRCGIPWRGRGIPADGLCLLAMQGAARPARQAGRALRRGRDESAADAMAESGTYDLVQAPLAAAEAAGKTFAAKAGCTANTAACMRSLPVSFRSRFRR
jgi:hypothetical protein